MNCLTALATIEVTVHHVRFCACVSSPAALRGGEHTLFGVCRNGGLVPPTQGLEVLHALVVIAGETAAARGVLRAAHEARDELSHRRYELRKAVSTAQKELRATAKAEGAGKGGEGDAAQEAAEGAKRTTRGQTESPRVVIERDRLALKRVEAQLDAAAVRLTQHLGVDRQHNDYWCVARGGAGGVMDFSAPLMVLCQEYSWVRPSPSVLAAGLCAVFFWAHAGDAGRLCGCDVLLALQNPPQHARHGSLAAASCVLTCDCFVKVCI